MHYLSLTGRLAKYEVLLVSTLCVLFKGLMLHLTSCHFVLSESKVCVNSNLRRIEIKKIWRMNVKSCSIAFQQIDLQVLFCFHRKGWKYSISCHFTDPISVLRSRFNYDLVSFLLIDNLID